MIGQLRMISENYSAEKNRLIKNFDKSIARIIPWLISRYGEERTRDLIRESQLEYEALIPQIPYIGDKNPFLIFLLPTSRYLAVYRALQNRGGTLDEAGQLIHQMSKAELRAIPGVVRSVIGYLWFSRWFVTRLKKRAQESQEREYPGGYVLTYVEGDGKLFDYGVDYSECASVKFLAAQNSLELATYVCATDKITSEMLGWGLRRTMTLAEGCDRCDFRFKKGGITNIGIP